MPSPIATRPGRSLRRLQPHGLRDVRVRVLLAAPHPLGRRRRVPAGTLVVRPCPEQRLQRAPSGEDDDHARQAVMRHIVNPAEKPRRNPIMLGQAGDGGIGTFAGETEQSSIEGGRHLLRITRVSCTCTPRLRLAETSAPPCSPPPPPSPFLAITDDAERLREPPAGCPSSSNRLATYTPC